MRFLFTTFEGGGHVPPALLVARRLQERGHEILFVSDEANRAAAASNGLTFEAWQSAPQRTTLGAADDPLDDWRPRFPPHVVRSVCDAVITGPAAAYAADTLNLIERFEPQAIVSNELLFGVMIAAERSGTLCALLTSNVWCFPTREDVPPFGPGFGPPTNAFEQGRDQTCRKLIARWYDVGLTDLNTARCSLGLAPLARTLDQLDRVSLILLGASRAFDYGVTAPPAPFEYAGPLGEAPAWAKAEQSDLVDPARPNILVSFSTTYQAQDAVVRRCVRALASLPVRGIVTLGPAVKFDGPAPPNVKVVRSADHDLIVPACAAMICHGGHGTVLRPLMHGVPVICVPTGRDQPDNAERIAHAGAGLRLPRGASTHRIRKAVKQILDNKRFAERAKALGEAVRAEADGGLRAAERLEALASSAVGSSEPFLARPA